MVNYYLSPEAEIDLMNIALYGLEHFGLEQSEVYRNKLKNRFRILAETPLVYPAVEHIRQDYRRSVCGVHSIYYRLIDGGVEIIRIIGRQKLEH